MLKRPAILCAGLLLAAAFAFGLVRLFELRFDQGDIYPPYSTLRSDPLGASVLYESLERVPGVTAQRYYDATFKGDNGRDQALFVLGAQPDSPDLIPRAEFDALQQFVYNGGRMVIAYYPEVSEPWSSRLADTNQTNNPAAGGRRSRHGHPRPESSPDRSAGETNLTNNADEKVETNRVNGTNTSLPVKPLRGRAARRHEKSNDQQDQSDQQDEKDLKEEMKQYTDLSEAWGFHLKYKQLETNDDGRFEFPGALRVASDADLPARLPIHTSLCFTNLTNGWVTIYQRDQKAPVVMERKFGAGSVVLVADSYPFSNEAMFKDRSAPLLAWMLGSGRDAIFDEAHLGIAERPGLATLMRRYQLHGLVFGLLLVAGLFVWKNSLGLVPPYADRGAATGPVIAGRDSAAGFVNLMRRSIPPAEIINVCFDQWTRSRARSAAISPAQRRDLEQLIHQQAALAPHLRKPVENYRVISQILQRRR